MSLRQDNDLHFRTPYHLLRIPEYMRWFDSTSLGSYYRLLSSKIYRRGVGQLRFYREGAMLTELAKKYDAGKLCCFITDEEIEEAMLLGDRTIKQMRADLINLKLIKAEKFKEGYIYQLGVVVKMTDEEGYEVGEEYEAHWIGKWYSWANADEKSEQMAAFRYYLAEKLGSDKKKAEIQTELCKIFPGIEKNFSKILDSSGTVKAPAARAKPAPVRGPIEVNTNESNNFVRPAPVSEGITVYSDDVDETQERLNQFNGRIKNRSYPISHISKDYRAMLDSGVDRSVLSKMILATVHEKNRFPELPLFSKHLDIPHKKPIDSFTWLWFALREDTVGSAPPATGKAQMYQEVKIAFEQALAKYSEEQILWTLRRIARDPGARMALVNNKFAIQKLLADNSAAYVTFKQNNVAAESKNAAQEAASKVDEVKRAEFLQAAAQSVMVSKVEEPGEDTIEHWENKLRNTTKPALVELYMRKIDEINRRNS